MIKCICERCGTTVHFQRVAGKVFRWVTNREKPKESWKCMPTKDFPLRTHIPLPQPEESKNEFQRSPD